MKKEPKKPYYIWSHEQLFGKDFETYEEALEVISEFGVECELGPDYPKHWTVTKNGLLFKTIITDQMGSITWINH